MLDEENKNQEQRTRLKSKTHLQWKKTRILISISSQGQKERRNDLNVLSLYRVWSNQYKHFPERSKGTFTFVHLIVFKIRKRIKIHK